MKDSADGGARRGVSRRRFLGGIGAGAAGAVTLGNGAGLLSGPAPAAADAAATNAAYRAGHFGRMFYLPAFGQPGPTMTAALLDIGRPGGILDARDNLAAGPLALMMTPPSTSTTPTTTARRRAPRSSASSWTTT